MGIAIIIPNISFSDTNLGQVTLSGNIPIVSIGINGPDNVTNKANFTVAYNPKSTTERGVVWSVISGSQYATINSSTGELSVLSGASNNSVTIRVTSTSDNSIYAEKTVTVTNTNVYAEKTALVTDGAAYINTGYTVKETSIFDYDYKYDTLRTYAGTAMYSSVFTAYSAENAPTTRHLILIQSANPKQLVQHGENKGSGQYGTSFKNNSLPIVGTRYHQVLSHTTFTDSGAGTWTKSGTGGFYAPTVPVTIGGGDETVEYFSFKIYEEDNLVMNFVPCTLTQNIPAEQSWDGQTHSSGENGFWDKVGGKFYGNANSSGSFTVIA